LLRAGNVQATTVERADAGGFSQDPVLPFFLERYAAAYRAELDAFLTAIAKKKSPAPSGEDGLRAQILADAATESSQTGKTVKVSL
ncbi:MAG: Gfo/Idh/MocA family oxidoreductase, partial [Beijerinckiaceae bacterium]